MSAESIPQSMRDAALALPCALLTMPGPSYPAMGEREKACNCAT